jgi:type II secretory pathway component PulC
MPSVDLQERSEDAFDDMVNRPLFLEGRRPSKALTAEQLKANVVSTGKFDWVLNGIYTSKRGVSGLFTRTLKNVPKDNYRRVRVEEALDGWVLTEILNDKVVLTQNGMSKELLLRKAKAKSSATKNGQSEQATVTNPVGVVVPSENSEDINNESLEEPIENSDNEDF